MANTDARVFRRFGLPSAEDVRREKLARLQQFAAMLEKTPYMRQALAVVRQQIKVLEGSASGTS